MSKTEPDLNSHIKNALAAIDSSITSVKVQLETLKEKKKLLKKQLKCEHKAYRKVYKDYYSSITCIGCELCNFYREF